MSLLGMIQYIDNSRIAEYPDDALMNGSIKTKADSPLGIEKGIFVNNYLQIISSAVNNRGVICALVSSDTLTVSNGNKFHAVYYTNDDGQTWNMSTLNNYNGDWKLAADDISAPDVLFSKIKFYDDGGDGHFAVIANRETDSYPMHYYSSSGANGWTGHALVLSGTIYFTDTAYGSNTYVFVGYDDNTGKLVTYYNTGGVGDDPNLGINSDDGVLLAVEYCSLLAHFTACGSDGNTDSGNGVIYYAEPGSPDQWYQVTSGVSVAVPLGSVLSTPSRIVVSSYDDSGSSYLLHTTDNASYTSNTTDLPSGYFVKAMSLNNDRIVAVVGNFSYAANAFGQYVYTAAVGTLTTWTQKFDLPAEATDGVISCIVKDTYNARFYVLGWDFGENNGLAFQMAKTNNPEGTWLLVENKKKAIQTTIQNMPTPNDEFLVQRIK